MSRSAWLLKLEELWYFNKRKMPQSTIIHRQFTHRWPAIVYQVYMRSFLDTNGDGVGDLQGVIQRLDYLNELGIGALWISPFYASPMVDFGYDVADYRAVDPLYGTLDDFKRLLDEAHNRNIKIIIDFVANHTSDQHTWFQQSKTSKDGYYADWYIWRDGLRELSNGAIGPPNNWLNALTGQSAWEWDEKRGQFYLHSFHSRQPDLNWNNKAVREAVKAVMRYWLDMGVDGFRIDAVYWMAKDPFFRDDDLNQNYISSEQPRYLSLMHNNSRGWPTLYAYLTDMAGVLQEQKYSDQPRFMITEAYAERHNPVATYTAFYTGMSREVAAPFNFEGIELAWRADEWRKFLKTFHNSLSDLSPEGVAVYAFGNHDNPRIASRLGEAAARSAAVMQLTLPGMVVVYYGEEIGMLNGEIPLELIQDPSAFEASGHGKDRDQFRTPMQWSPDKHAGFSTASQTWLPIPPTYRENNVSVENNDPRSFLNLYRRLGKLRRRSNALKHGSIEILETHKDVLAYVRSLGDERYLTLINFSAQLVLGRLDLAVGEFILSSNARTQLTQCLDKFELLPNEGALFKL